MNKEEIIKYLKTIEQELQEEKIQVIMNKNNAIYYTETLNHIDKQDHTIDTLKEEVEFQRIQRKYWRDSYYQKIDQIYNEKDLINKEAEIMKDNTIKIFTAQDIIKAKFQVIDKLLGE